METIQLLIKSCIQLGCIKISSNYFVIKGRGRNIKPDRVL